MQEVWEVLETIWEMEWWEVLIIAAADDAILLVKLWPIWLAIIIITTVATITAELRK